MHTEKYGEKRRETADLDCSETRDESQQKNSLHSNSTEESEHVYTELEKR